MPTRWVGDDGSSVVYRVSQGWSGKDRVLEVPLFCSLLPPAYICTHTVKSIMGFALQDYKMTKNKKKVPMQVSFAPTPLGLKNSWTMCGLPL